MAYSDSYSMTNLDFNSEMAVTIKLVEIVRSDELDVDVLNMANVVYAVSSGFVYGVRSNAQHHAGISD